MKSIVTEGTVERVACETCRRFVEATYAYGQVAIDGLVVEDVMRATCNTCGSVVSLAPQSAHRFKLAADDRRHRRTTLRISRELQDFISLNLSLAGAGITQIELYFRALLLACDGREQAIGQQLAALQSEILSRPNRVTVNLSLGSHLLGVLGNLQAASQISGIGELLRRLLVLADGPIEDAVQFECQRLVHAYA